jgi:Ca-activated chloride channel family protein
MIARIILTGCLMIAVLSAVFAQASAPRVELSLIVTDKENKSLSTLRKEDIHVFEDNVEQTILSIETDQRPIDLGIAIDTTGSFRRLLPAAVQSAKLIVINRRPDDQIFIERFISSDKIEKVQDFTSDGDVLLKSLDTLYIEQGQTAVVDALYIAAKYVAEHNKAAPGRRKAVVIMTDGEDRNSYYESEKLIKLLRENKVQVFVLGIVVNLDKESGLVRTSPRENAEKLLKRIAEESGGRVFFSRDGKELLEATKQVILDLRGQYRVTYQSSNPDPKKNFRKVEVKFISTDGQKRTGIAPRGYYVQVKPTEKKSP